MNEKTGDSAPKGGVANHTTKSHFHDFAISDGQAMLMLAGLGAFGTGLCETVQRHHVVPMVVGSLIFAFGITSSFVRAYWCAKHDG